MIKQDIEDIVLQYNEDLFPDEPPMDDTEMKGILGELDFIVQCAWCQPVVNVKLGSVWFVIDGIPAGVEISHGICPECQEAERRELETLIVKGD